jgi:hypothetical protein
MSISTRRNLSKFQPPKGVMSSKRTEEKGFVSLRGGQRKIELDKTGNIFYVDGNQRFKIDVTVEMQKSMQKHNLSESDLKKMFIDHLKKIDELLSQKPLTVTDTCSDSSADPKCSKDYIDKDFQDHYLATENTATYANIGQLLNRMNVPFTLYDTPRYDIKSGKNQKEAPGRYETPLLGYPEKRLFINPLAVRTSKIDAEGSKCFKEDPYLATMHEMIYALHERGNSVNLNPPGYSYGNYTNMEEYNTIQSVNDYSGIGNFVPRTAHADLASVNYVSPQVLEQQASSYNQLLECPSSSSGLSLGQKAGIGAGAGVGGLALLGLVARRYFIKKKETN